jgi:tryptophan-rich hypothetical protein
MTEPRDPRRLVGSKWTRRAPGERLCHWIAIERSGAEVVLQAVLEPAATQRLAWRALRDRARWQPGWR